MKKDAAVEREGRERVEEVVTTWDPSVSLGDMPPPGVSV